MQSIMRRRGFIGAAAAAIAGLTARVTGARETDEVMTFVNEDNLALRGASERPSLELLDSTIVRRLRGDSAQSYSGAELLLAQTSLKELMALRDEVTRGAYAEELELYRRWKASPPPGKETPRIRYCDESREVIDRRWETAARFASGKDTVLKERYTSGRFTKVMYTNDDGSDFALLYVYE